MRWYHYVAYFFGGAFLANTLPHLGNGICGNAGRRDVAQAGGRRHRNAGRSWSQGAEEDRHLRAARVRQVRRREEARQACSRGNQSLHEGEAEVRGEAHQQGREGPTGEGDQGSWWGNGTTNGPRQGSSVETVPRIAGSRPPGHAAPPDQIEAPAHCDSRSDPYV
jgi:hypothetical protein